MRKFTVTASKRSYGDDIDSKIIKIENTLNDFDGIIPDNKIKVRRTESKVYFTGRYDFVPDYDALDYMPTYGKESVSNYGIANQIYDGDPVNIFEDVIIPELQNIAPVEYRLRKGGLGEVQYVEFRVILSV